MLLAPDIAITRDGPVDRPKVPGIIIVALAPSQCTFNRSLILYCTRYRYRLYGVSIDNNAVVASTVL